MVAPSSIHYEGKMNAGMIMINTFSNILCTMK